MWTAIDFKQLGFVLTIYQENINNPMINLKLMCPDNIELSGCNKGTTNRPFLDKPNLVLYGGSRGAHNNIIN